MLPFYLGEPPSMTAWGRKFHEEQWRAQLEQFVDDNKASPHYYERSTGYLWVEGLADAFARQHNLLIRARTCTGQFAKNATPDWLMDLTAQIVEERF
jgi:hypothetical protein